MSKFFSATLAFLLILSACSPTNKKQPVVTSAYEKYLDSEAKQEKITQNERNIAFYTERFDKDTLSPGNGLFLATALAAKFDLHHDLKDLEKSNRMIRSILSRDSLNVAARHQAVQNAITRHRFNDAMNHAQLASTVNISKTASDLMIVDVLLEKGNFRQARMNLEALGEPHRFDRLIRMMKLQDAEDNLDGAILTMESALQQANEMNKDGLKNWSLSNLGDMYGHQGEIQKSYDSFLQALEINPADEHSLKGIGWIAMAHDGDLGRAEKIWSFLLQQSDDPGLHLLMAELMELKENPAEAEKHLNAFIKKVDTKRYGNMYGSYLVGILADVDSKRAHEIAKADLEQRKHPVTYSNLALTTLKLGQKEEAVKLIEEYVIGRTGEPDALLNIGVIYDETGNAEKAKEFLTLALEAGYELGPITTREVQKRLYRLQS